MVSLSVQSGRESFPFKREFINPEELWNNAITLNLSPIRVVIPEERWRNLPRNLRWKFQNKTVALVVDDNAYDKINKLVDYFSEEPRIHGKRKGCSSQFDYYNANYDTVVSKAQDLMRQNPTQPLRFHLREALYLLNKECSSFSISITKEIFRYFGSKIVLDPSAGWGDRLLGAAAAGVLAYHGVDPNSSMETSYNEMISFVRDHSTIGENYSVLIDDFLKASIEKESYDTVFTSPPFFDYEIYSNDPGQSIIGRTDVKEWLDDFLYPYLRKAWDSLVIGGYMILHISNTGTDRYVQSMSRFVNDDLHGEFFGIIAITDAYLNYAWPLWVWRKR